MLIKDFRFHDYGKYSNNTCIAAITLPKYKLSKIITGQITQDRKDIWEKTINLKYKNKTTPIVNSIKIKKAKNNIRYNIENYKLRKNKINISGWAFIPEIDTKNIATYFIATNETNKRYIIKAYSILRYDVSEYFKNKNLKLSGFETTLYKKDFSSGHYTLKLLLIDLDRHIQHVVPLNNKFTIGF